jgi:glutamate carboxypeptidase
MPVTMDRDIIRGPGVYDMKGGLTQMVFALRVLKLLGQQPQVTPVVLINSDEEIGSKESTPYIRRLAKIADRAFILEPSLGLAGKLKTERKGVGRFTIKVQGRSAHAGLDPTAGASAIVELSHIIQKLFIMNDPEKQISVNVGMVEGGVRPNVVAPESTAIVDVRVPTQKDAERISRKIHELKPEDPKVKVWIEGSIGRPPMEATPENRLLWEKARGTGALLGIELEESMAGGGSDGNTTSLYTATLDGLGATGDGAHAPHEFIYIDKMMERTALLALLLMMEPLTNPTTKS